MRTLSLMEPTRRAWMLVASLVGLGVGIAPIPAPTQAHAYTCDKINGFRPCVTGYVAEGRDNPNIVQGNFCSSDQPWGAQRPSGSYWQCARWIRYGTAQAVQGHIGADDGSWQGSLNHEQALAHPCSYAAKDPDGVYRWHDWLQGGPTVWRGVGLSPMGSDNGFCTATYGSAFGRFYTRPTAGPGDIGPT